MSDVCTCPQCGGDKRLETTHPEWGTRTCPEAYIMVDCPRCDGAGVILLREAMLELLGDVEAYLDRFTDAEIDPLSGRTIGNEAMQLFERVHDAIQQLEQKP